MKKVKRFLLLSLLRIKNCFRKIVYIVNFEDLTEDESVLILSNSNKKDFIRIAKTQGNVFYLNDFINAVNGNYIDLNNCLVFID